MDVIFTDYDTVKIGTEEEITTKKFFKEFEYLIKNGEITNCNYNPENEEFSYLYDNRRYIVKITNKSIHKFRNLLSLMQLEQNESIKRKNERITENEKQELLRKARNGEIVSNEAKTLYIKELKSEIKLSNVFKKLKLEDIAKRYFKLDLTDTEEWREAITTILTLITFTSLFVFPILFITEVLKATPGLIILMGASFIEFMVCLATSNNGGSLVSRALTYIIWTIINIIGNIIKLSIDFARAICKFIPQIMLIKHKIKSLKNYKIPNEEIILPDKKEENDNDVLTSYIAKSIDNIYLNLLKLNDEDKREIRKELETKLKEYQKSLLSIPKSGLTLETEVTVSNRFIMSLAEIELKINQKLNSKLKNDLIVASIDHINEDNNNDEDNKSKKRVLQI